MNTNELLAVVEPEFPDLTPKTLKDWVKEGFLQPPERVGMGTDGTPNEWAVDSVHRIKVIKSVTVKRVDKSRVRKALIAAGYYIGAQALRDEMLKQSEEFGYMYACTQSDQVTSGKAGAMLMNKDLGDVIASALIAPTFLTDKCFAALQREAGNVVRDGSITRLLNMNAATPLTNVLELFSVYNVHDYLTHSSDTQLLDAFNDSTNLFNMVCPSIGWLVGYDEYPPLPDSCILAKFVQRRDTAMKLEIYEFEYLLRLVCIAGCLTVAARKDELVRLLPEAMTYVLIHTHIEATETDGVCTISDGVASTNDSNTINKFITTAHNENVTFARSLLK